MSSINCRAAMFDTIESTHGKIVEKIAAIKGVIQETCAPTLLDLRDTLLQVETDYNLAVVSILQEYYSGTAPQAETRYTRKYYRIIAAGGFIAELADIIERARRALSLCHLTPQVRAALAQLAAAQQNTISLVLERINIEICKCGAKMTFVPEAAELRCQTEGCGKVRTIVGSISFDQQHQQEGQPQKCSGGYDTSRHYRFWSERLQALESKNFDQKDLDNIEYIITRDNYDRRLLTCEQMREILKDSRVAATRLNDHAPLLVKMFGGMGPPHLDFQENRLTSIRFAKAMCLYDVVNPTGGNKPYYPYFIYKIWEEMFRDNPAKLRLLDYIHLQSRETVIKNDKFYKMICDISEPGDGLVYRCTDPTRQHS